MYPQRRKVCRKIKSVGQVEPSWRRHPNPHGSGPSKCGVRHSQPHPFHVAEFVPAAKHPMLVGLAQGRREGGPAIELPKVGELVSLGNISDRIVARFQWPTHQPNNTNGATRRHSSKGTTHGAFRGHPTQGPAAGPANLGRQLRPAFPDQAQRSMPWTNSIEPGPDCRHI